MQCDETIWACVGKEFCSFRATFQNIKLCRNVYNVTGQCSRASCPLANSYYGTILEQHGKCFLYLKTIERAHTPRKLWEKIKLSDNKDKALEQIQAHMKNIYKDHHIKKCTLRYLKIREYLSRMRKISLKPKTILEHETHKLARREKNREMAALKAAHLQTSVQEELLARLKAGVYGEIYNFSQNDFNKIVAMGKDDTIAEFEDSEDEEEIERGEETCDEEDIEDLKNSDDESNELMEVEVNQ